MAETFGDQPVGATVQSCPLTRKEQPTYWVEIELFGEDQRPIPWEEYLVVLPDGTRAPGFLDGEGFARFECLTAAGTCRISFPNLDRDCWKNIATLPAKEAGR